MGSEACEWKEDESPQGALESALWVTDMASKSYTVWLDGKSVGRSQCRHILLGRHVKCHSKQSTRGMAVISALGREREADPQVRHPILHGKLQASGKRCCGKQGKQLLRKTLKVDC